MTTVTGGQMPPTLPLDSCEIAYLVAMARKHRLPFYFSDHGCVVRPIRNATAMQLQLHAALITRRDEVGAYLLATRPHPFDPDAEADAASWRVCRMPHEALVALTIYNLNQWLAAADRGIVRYEPLPVPSLSDVTATPAKPRKRPARTGTAQSDRVVY